MKSSIFQFMLCCVCLLPGLCPAQSTVNPAASVHESEPPYVVARTGDNYTFKFEHSPGDDTTAKLTAGLRVLRDVYQDDSIHDRYSESYIRERARCYLFDSRFYSYTLCFFPNEFTHNKTDRLRGFVTQMPNWRWLMTRFFLPAGLLFGLFFYLRNPRHAD